MSEQTEESTLPQWTLTTEEGLYAAAFVVALGVRLFQIGVAPLTDFEASWALNALSVARSWGLPAQALQVGVQPLYAIFTGFLFFLIEESNGLARLLPALAGSLLVLLPLLLRPVRSARKASKREPAADGDFSAAAGVFLAFMLALDPALIFLSRTAGSAMPALSFGLLCLALAWRGSVSPLVGILAALALLSGPGVFPGLLLLGLLWLAQRAAGSSLPGLDWRRQLLPAGLVLGALGTAFLTVPQGLAGLAASLPAYLSTWTSVSSIPALRLPGALAVYQPLALIFGLIGLGRACVVYLSERSVTRRFGLEQILGIWFLLALALAMLAPGRQVADLLWALVPLWGLAALELAEYLDFDDPLQERLVWGLAGVITFILLMGGYNLLYLKEMQATTGQLVGILAALVGMAVVVALLAAAGWNIGIARLGLAWGVAFMLALLTLAPGWRMAQTHPNGPAELWSLGGDTGQLPDLAQTLEMLSTWQSGHTKEVEVVSTVDAPSLRWLLRAYPQARFQQELGLDEAAPVIITELAQDSPALLGSYRGQDFALHNLPGWNGVFPPDIIEWLAYRNAPTAPQKLILWGRSDVFPGGALQTP